MEQLSSTYDHQRYEKKWWDFWIKGGWFHAEVDRTRTPYTVLIPPPNVTARLHMGHGLNNTLQDILVRWKRMSGFNACWLPGTDHAGIATQMMVEKSLAAEGIRRQDLGREEFFARCVEWKEENGHVIVDQLCRLGCSCDWDRQAYTMDEGLSKAVRRIFVDLFRDGLIYRGTRLVNWDPALKTAISDDEVVNQDQAGFLWHIRYPVEGASDQFLEVATTRPETLFGDTAVAVHPDDARYQSLLGRRVVVPFVERSVPIVADKHVKADFGSGCLKITPAHDYNDFDVGQRHALEAINILHDDGTLNDICPPPFAGMDRFEARKAVVKALEDRGLLVRTEKIKHSVPYSDRSKAAVEPRLSEQWYVRMKELVKPAIEAARSGKLKFYPNTWEKTYFHWLDNIQDWCISRQLWWGHRIPIWHCADCQGVTSSLEDPSSCEHCGSANIQQDSDVLDTWFSSWLWPLSPFGWPEEREELDYFFPSNVLVTGPEIIFLWVARMVMVSYYVRSELPFPDVYFNSTICDKKGRKFSKTLGNGIDPSELIDQYGADAVRFTCISLAPLGSRVRMDRTDFEHGHRFINKLWNASRFLRGRLEELGMAQQQLEDFDEARLDLPSQWLVSRLAQAAERVDGFLTSYQMNAAADELYHFIWGAFCDWGLEAAKETMDSGDVASRRQSASFLCYILEGALRLASPFIPFVTEELWQTLPHHPRWPREDSLVIAAYPQGESICRFDDAAREWELVQDLITGIRSVRSQAAVPPKERVDVSVACDVDVANCFTKCESWIRKLAGVGSLRQGEISSGALITTGKGWAAYVLVGDFLDVTKEVTRLRNEAQRINKILKGLSGKLSNEKFMANAPADIVDGVKSQQQNLMQQLSVIETNLKNLT